MARTEFPTRLQLKVGERREILIEKRAGDQVIVGAACAEEPRAVVPERRRAFQHDVPVRDADRRRALKVSAPGTGLDDQQRGQTVAVRDPESSGGKLEALDRLGVEGARNSEKAIRVVNLDPVHHGQVLVRRATPHREPAAEVVRGGHARQQVERAEHVVDATCDLKHLFGWDWSGRRPRLRDGLGHDLDGLGKGVPEQPDLDVRTHHRHARLQVAVCPKPHHGFSLTQHDGETPIRTSRDRLPATFHTHVRNWHPRGAVDDDARHRGRVLRRGARRPREQYPDQQKACKAHDGKRRGTLTTDWQ